MPHHEKSFGAKRVSNEERGVKASEGRDAFYREGDPPVTHSPSGIRKKGVRPQGPSRKEPHRRPRVLGDRRAFYRIGVARDRGTEKAEAGHDHRRHTGRS